MEFIRENKNSNHSLRIAVVGCLHGNLKDAYDYLKDDELKTGKKTDLLLCCGDFECIRNTNDLRYLSCPEKYKQMGQFKNYYNSNNDVPILTIFIGGNHEASNVLDENFYGGWITKNIFYLGRAGVIKYKGLRIAGLSGIYKNFDYYKGHFEKDILKDIKSIYHVREFEIAKLSHLTGEIDFLMTHDWPRGTVNPKHFKNILKTHYHWKDELINDSLGSPASKFLVKLLKPKYIVSGHMHYTYFNEIKHNDEQNSVTKFIALDKAGTKRKRYFLHSFDYFLSESSLYKNEDILFDNNIYYDEEWLAITKAFNPHIPLDDIYTNFSNFIVSKDEYINCLYDNYSYTWKNKVNNFFPSKDFDENLKNLYNDFYLLGKGKILWEYLLDQEQRNKFLSIAGIEDYHRSKIKKINISESKNNEEIEIDINFDI